MYLNFYRNNLVELKELLHEAHLNKNGDIHKLETQNEKLRKRLQGSCSSSYVSYCHIVYCLENPRDMRDHEIQGKLQVLDVFEYHLNETQSHFLMKEELGFPLENGYTVFVEVHDSTTLEPTYKKSFFILEGGACSYPYGFFT